MAAAKKSIQIDGQIGWSAGRKVFLAFAPAHLLYRLSFADVLNEETGKGYQRPFNRQHSLDFRRYIQGEHSATIPLTFNLRSPKSGAWKITERGRTAVLTIEADAGKVLAQVDCQHRLGHLEGQSISFPFMSFIGLSEKEEMEIFSVINGKAKGLSTSLLDYHAAQMADDLGQERPELFIALTLNNDSRSPWFRQLYLGGTTTSGLARRASLRTMQKAIKRFLQQTRLQHKRSPEDVAELVLEYWVAIATVLPTQWANPRKHFITKGIGVYALMSLAGDMVVEASSGDALGRRHFETVLADFITDIDWSHEGAFKGLGGEEGAKQALTILRNVRKKSKLRVISNG